MFENTHKKNPHIVHKHWKKWRAFIFYIIKKYEKKSYDWTCISFIYKKKNSNKKAHQNLSS